MKKFGVIILLVLFALSINGCSSNNSTQITSEITEEPEYSTQSTTQPTEMWQEAYAEFLKEFPFLNNDDFSVLSREDVFYQFCLKDLDNSGIPELLIFKTNMMCSDDIFYAYTYDGNVCKLGEYSNRKRSFISWFRIPGDPLYPGLYECWHGGGQEYCQYLSVKDGELTCEYLWHMDRSGEEPLLTELYDNKQLVNDSIDAFPPYLYTENLLEVHFINDETIDKIILALKTDT